MIHKPALTTIVALLAVLGGLTSLGCESDVGAKEDILLPSERKNWVELDLGQFTITVLIADDPSRQPDFEQYQESVALHYRLHCLVAKENEEHVKKCLEESKGQISDEVIKTCRHANLIDLADPELQLIRSQLRDFTEEFVGRGMIKRFVFSEVSLERY